jgi:hypothetical protein
MLREMRFWARLGMNQSTDCVGGIVRLKARAVREVEVLSR